MAAPMRIPQLKHFFELLPHAKLTLYRYLVPSVHLSQSRYTHQQQQSVDHVVTVTEDGQTIVCWHPEQEFPYEHTKPLSRKEYDLKHGDSPLKIQHFKENKKKNTDGPSDKELSDMFYVTKHVWRLQPGKKKANKNVLIDRKAL